MRIIIVGPGHPLRGGIANFNEALCHSLQQEGHDCEIVSFTLQYPSILFPGKTQFDDGPAPDGLKITPMINSVRPTSWSRTARYIKEQQPDLVIFRFWIPFMGRCLGSIAKKMRKAGIRTLAICDNVIPHESRFGDRPLTKYFLKQIDSYVVMSRSVGDDLRSFNVSGPIEFLPHPIYDIFGSKVDKASARKELGLEPDGKYVLFFGLIRKYKGLDLLLQALSQLEGIKLIVAGEFYDKKESYISMIETMGITDQVIMHDEYIPNDRVKLYFSACDLVAQTYHTATQSGITQVAYNFDCPMLVTNVGGLAEIVEHQKVGYVVDKQPISIANAIGDFFSNNRGSEFSTNVASAKERFSWESFTKGLLALSSE